jgi:hypothetical protein
MATLAEIREQYPQYSDMSDGDLAGALHTKFYSDMPREEFDKKMGLAASPTPDKYQTAAADEFSALKAKGSNPEYGYARRIAQGMTLGGADELLAGAMVPFEMIKRGTFNPAEAYRYTKAREDYAMDEARQRQGALGTAAEIAGGVGTGAGLARNGVTAARMLAPGAGLGARSLAMGADGVAFGGISGGLEGNGLADRAQNAGLGGLLGGVVGAAAPAAFSLGSSALSPVINNVRARINPEGFARSQVARGVMESGQTPQQLAGQVATAANEGQGMFTLADAMGNSGQRMLSATARAPGTGRTEVVDFLEGRQAGQGRRVAGALAEGFNAPQTAAQAERGLTAARDTRANAEYGQVRADATPVDISPVLARIDATIRPGVNQVAGQSAIANDTAEAALAQVRARLSDGQSNLTDFTAIQRVRGDLSDAVQQARQSGAGNRARLLGDVLREMDGAMEAASAGHRQANANFAQASRNIEAVGSGRDAALRGRTEDTIPAFRALLPQGQAAFRAGYADPLIEQAQGAAFGVNKARPLTSDAFREESQAIAPLATGNQMTRRIGRENTMFETRNHALGGSRTADNLADQSAMGVDPTLIGQVVSGNWGGALRTALASGSNALSGNTAAVREQVARMLLSRGQNVNPASIQSVLDETIRRIERVQEAARQIGRGVAGGVAVSPSAAGARRQ